MWRSLMGMLFPVDSEASKLKDPQTKHHNEHGVDTLVPTPYTIELNPKCWQEDVAHVSKKTAFAHAHIHAHHCTHFWAAAAVSMEIIPWYPTPYTVELNPKCWQEDVAHVSIHRTFALICQIRHLIWCSTYTLARESIHLINGVAFYDYYNYTSISTHYLIRLQLLYTFWKQITTLIHIHIHIHSA